MIVLRSDGDRAGPDRICGIGGRYEGQSGVRRTVDDLQPGRVCGEEGVFEIGLVGHFHSVGFTLEPYRLRCRGDFPFLEGNHLDRGIAAAVGIENYVSFGEFGRGLYHDGALTRLAAFNYPGEIGAIGAGGDDHGCGIGSLHHYLIRYGKQLPGADQESVERLALEGDLDGLLAGKLQHGAVQQRQDELGRIRGVDAGEDADTVHFLARGDLFIILPSIDRYPPIAVLDLDLRHDAVNRVGTVGGSCTHLVAVGVGQPFAVDRPVVEAVLRLHDADGDEGTAVTAVLSVGNENGFAVLE